jgi:nucleoside-diphosphate-sugar epimerase
VTSRVLITGAGLVGAQIARLEQEAGRPPVLFDMAPRHDALKDFVDLERCEIVRGDLLSPLDLVAVVKAKGITHIVHTAAYPGLTVGAVKAPLASVQVNFIGTAHVLEVARLMDVERVVVCSSSALYTKQGGDDRGAPGHEEAWPRSVTLYSTAKQAAEDLALNYVKDFGLDVRAVRYASVFGPWKAGGGGIATTTMEQYLRGAQAGGPVRVDAPRREWVYSKDAALGTLKALWTDQIKDRVFNIGMGLSVSGEDIAAALRDLFPGSDVQVSDGPTEGPYAAGDMPAMSATRARKQLDFHPCYPMAVALADYRDWLLSAGAPG